MLKNKGTRDVGETKDNLEVDLQSWNALSEGEEVVLTGKDGGMVRILACLYGFRELVAGSRDPVTIGGWLYACRSRCHLRGKHKFNGLDAFMMS